MLSQSSAIELVRDSLYPAWEAERDRLDHIDKWYRWQQTDLTLPRTATPEMKALADLSKTPWLSLVVTTVAQCMYADGWRSGSDSDPVGPWTTWQANDFDHRQIAIHRAALAYGIAYVTVLPGDTASAMRGVSPRKMHAVYGDPAEDDWPMFAIRVEAQGDSQMIRLYDDEREHWISWSPNKGDSNRGPRVEYIEYREHNAGVCPVVRYTNMLDLDGRSAGEVEPFIAAAERINKTSFDRLVTQHFSSWKVRTVSGMAEPENEAEAKRARLLLRQGDLLIGEDPDTKFGTLDETPLDGFIKAWRADIEALAAVSQTPAHELTGQLVNLSSEALAAARAALTQKVTERQKSFGRSHAQALRLAAAFEGDSRSAQDVMGRVTWQDMEIRSLSQAVDALGKAVTMLGVPARGLWGRIPGVEATDVEEWIRMADAEDPLTRMQSELERQANAAVADSV